MAAACEALGEFAQQQQAGTLQTLLCLASAPSSVCDSLGRTIRSALVERSIEKRVCSVPNALPVLNHHRLCAQQMA